MAWSNGQNQIPIRDFAEQSFKILWEFNFGSPSDGFDTEMMQKGFCSPFGWKKLPNPSWLTPWLWLFDLELGPHADRSQIASIKD